MASPASTRQVATPAPYPESRRLRAVSGPRAPHSRLRRFLIIVAGILLLLVAVRLILPTAVKRFALHELNRDPLYHATIGDVSIHLLRGEYAIHRFALRSVRGQKQYPLVSTDEIRAGVGWSELLHGRVKLRVEVRGLEVNFVQERQTTGEKQVTLGRNSAEGKRREAEDWKAVLKKLIPIQINRLIVHGRSIHFRDPSSSPPVNVFLDQLEVRGENLTNVSSRDERLFGRIDFRARAMGSGLLHVRLLLNPLVNPPEFKATTELKDLQLTQLNDFFRAYGKFDVKGGTFGLYSEMATAHGRIKGYVKPIMHDLQVADLSKDVKHGGIFHAAWEAIVGAIAGLFKNQSKDQQAAVIPIEGRIDDPKTSAWDTIQSILYNMFVRPISARTNNSISLRDLEKKGKPSLEKAK